MEASHTTICKFASETDDLYLRVADHMLELLTWIMQSVAVESLPSIVIQATEGTERVEIEPPPSYASLNETPDIKHPGKELSEGSVESDSSDGDEISRGLFSRIRAASPFRSASPRPIIRARKASSDEPLSEEPVQITWPMGMSQFFRVNHLYRMLRTIPSHAPISSKQFLHKSVRNLATDRFRDEPRAIYSLAWRWRRGKDANHNPSPLLVPRKKSRCVDHVGKREFIGDLLHTPPDDSLTCWHPEH